MKAKIKIENSPPAASQTKGHKMQTRTLTRTEELQESREMDRDKYERLCCLGNELTCQRLGSKHHRTNAKCWVYPEVCYHCDLAALTDRKEKSLCVASVRIQLKMLNTSLSPSVMESVPSEVTSINQRSFRINNEIQYQEYRGIGVGGNPGKSASPESTPYAQQGRNHRMFGDIHSSLHPGSHLEPDPDLVMNTIEKYESVGRTLLDSRNGGDSCSKMEYVGRRYCRSQAPSPDIRMSSAPSDPQHSHKSVQYEFVGRAGRFAKRDPRYELVFLLNEF